ncbi:hypothetical protein [Flavobacterium panici]|uniref:Uncharacterized protein n=1 Tax=Flavobacterium panici TaxID=2654843 RepID=A0A9N8P0D8_9FLAO|nr:hypothetical protein [Flavobacterium panici]CAC9972888.1 hypothetical protein FLAPXU55_00567 [Flavobacterium panici]
MKDKFLSILKSSRLDLTDLIVCADMGTELDKSVFDLCPKDFLRWAKIDLKGGNLMGHINSLTNSKRAIDCQIDSVFEALGIKSDNFNKEFADYVKLFDFEDDNIPIKLKIIHSINLAPSLIIFKTRSLRNKLEHLYQQPKEDEVKEAVDIADLFIRCVDGKTDMINSEFFITDGKNFGKSRWHVEKNLYFKFDTDLKNFSIKIKNTTSDDSNLEEVIIDSNDKEFIAILNLMFSINDDFDCEDAIVKLLQFAGHKIPSEQVNAQIG